MLGVSGINKTFVNNKLVYGSTDSVHIFSCFLRSAEHIEMSFLDVIN